MKKYTIHLNELEYNDLNLKISFCNQMVSKDMLDNFKQVAIVEKIAATETVVVQTNEKKYSEMLLCEICGGTYDNHKKHLKSKKHTSKVAFDEYLQKKNETKL